MVNYATYLHIKRNFNPCALSHKCFKIELKNFTRLKRWNSDNGKHQNTLILNFSTQMILDYLISSDNICWQAYRICILTARGACKIKFQQWEANDESNNDVTTKSQSFGLEKFGNYKTSPYSRSGVSSHYCLRDFLRIPDGSSQGYLNAPSRDR